MRTAVLWLLLSVAGAEAGGTNDLKGAEVIAARQVYVAKCAKCHRFYEPRKYSDTEWRVWMEKMGKKSKLKREQATLLSRYLDAYRAGALTSKPEGQ